MNERQKRFAAHVDTLRKRAATGDVIAKQELVRISQMAAQAARQMREQQVLGALALAQQVRAQREAQDEAERAALYTPDRLDIADATADLAVGADSLDKKVATRNAEWQQLDAMAPFMRTNPVSALNGTLGNQATLRIGPNVDASEGNAQVALWQGDDAETGPVTVTLAPVVGVQSPNVVSKSITGGNVPIIRPYAIVQFGTRGFAANFEVDIGLGCQFTLTASTVSVQVLLEQTAGALDAETEVQLSGMLSFGPTNRQPAPITRSKWINVGAGSTSSAIPIPAFAKRVYLLNGIAAATWALAFKASDGSTLYGLTGTGTMTVPAMIANGIYTMTVQATGGDIVRGALVFELEF